MHRATSPRTCGWPAIVLIANLGRRLAYNRHATPWSTQGAETMPKGCRRTTGVHVPSLHTQKVAGAIPNGHLLASLCIGPAATAT
jgi:hypothetical protein